MLSKLALLVSRGRYSPASMSRPSRSFTDCVYSARLRRWKVRPPGLGFRRASSSMVFSSVSTRASRVSPAGRGMPGGGIMPARSLRIMRSAVSAFSAAASTWKPDKVMLPVRRASLWQTWQYWATTSVSVAAGRWEAARAWSAGEAGTGGASGKKPLPLAPTSKATPRTAVAPEIAFIPWPPVRGHAPPARPARTTHATRSDRPDLAGLRCRQYPTSNIGFHR